MENLDFNVEHWQDKKCPPINCKKKTCKCGLEKVFLPAALGDDSKTSQIAPKNGAYCDAIVVYEANGHIYIYSKEGIPTLMTSGGGGDYDEIIKEIQEDLTKTENDLAKEVLDRAAGDKTLQDEIDEMKNSPDVVDIVDTYADLQAYDTSKLGDNDIIRVLTDETHDDQSSYYRWGKQSGVWTYIGSVGGSSDFVTLTDADANYTDAEQTDWIAVWKLTTGAYKLDESATINLALTAEEDYVVQSVGASQMPFLLVDNDGDYVRASIWCNDATYLGEVEISSANGSFNSFITGVENFTGTDGEDDGYAGLVPAPTTADAGKVLGAGGSWVNQTSYSDFTGTDGVDAGTHGLVPAPTTSDVDKFLKSDGTWATAGGGGPTVVQATGTSQTDVMSQNATTKMVFADPSTKYKVQVGYNTETTGSNSVCIGAGAYDSGTSNAVVIGNSAHTGSGQYDCIAIGNVTNCVPHSSIAIGRAATVGLNLQGGIALGAYSTVTRKGEMNIGTSWNATGFNNTAYRVIGGVHDGQDLHDAATLAQGNTLSASAPDSSTVGVLGQLWTDTTNMHTYQCTAISGSTYTWTQRW